MAKITDRSEYFHVQMKSKSAACPANERAYGCQQYRDRFLLKASVGVTAMMAAFLLIGPVSAQSFSTEENQADGTAPEENEADRSAPEEIVVTGSRIGRSDYTAVPVEVIGREEIMGAGVPTITDIVKNLTINTGSNFNADFSTQRQSAGTSQVNLRGLTIGSTLTLVNGRRTTLTATSNDDGATFVDINQYPLLMVERVEVLKDGGSAIYGSDAVAGVFNIITRKGFEGFETMGFVQTTTNGQATEDISISVAMGTVSSRGEFALYFDYFSRTNLTGDSRSFVPGGEPGSLGNTSGLGHVPTLIFGEPATQGPFAASGVTGFVLDPDCGVENSIPAPFVAGADPQEGVGGFCRASFRSSFDLFFAEDRLIGFSEGTYHISDNLDFFGEISVAFNNASSSQARSGGILRQELLIPSDHPANTFGVDVTLFGRVAEPERSTRAIDNNYFRVVGGFEYAISDNWDTQISVVFSKHEFTVLSSVTNLDVLTVPTGNPDQPFAIRPDFNPFGSRFTSDGPVNDPALLEEILGTARNFAKSSLTTAEFSASGDLGDFLQLPGGKIGVAFGTQLRNDTLSIDNDDLIERGATGFEGQAADTPFVDRNTYAGYGEVFLPILDNLDITAAFRHESFQGGIKSTNDTKVAIHYSPIDALTLRGSFATAFRTPTLFQTDVTAQTTLPIAFDPFRSDTSSACDITNGQLIFPGSIATGNPELTPENARSYLAGVVVQPRSTGLKLSFDYWRFEVERVIVKDSLQGILNSDCQDDGIANDPRIQRGAGGQIRNVLTPFINAASLDTDGFDLSISYALAAGNFGDFGFTFKGTFIRTYEFRLTPGGPKIEGEGNRNFSNPFAPAPRWRTNFIVDWTKGMVNSNAILRFISSFADDNNGSDPNARVGNHVTLDLQTSIALGEILPALGGANITLGAINVTNNAPPAAVGLFGFETKVHDPRGRLVYLRISESF